jgi:tRNA dimethylallyltransferase
MVLLQRQRGAGLDADALDLMARAGVDALLITPRAINAAMLQRLAAPFSFQRAHEVYRATGRPISEWQRETQARHAWRFSRLALVPTDRTWLHERIEQRFRQMMQEGFLEEVRALRARSSLTPEAPSLRAVGYRQLWAHLAGEFDLPTAVARAIVATRQLAKRQLTWIHADPDWEGLDPQQEALIEAKVAALQRGSLS